MNSKPSAGSSAVRASAGQAAGRGTGLLTVAVITLEADGHCRPCAELRRWLVRAAENSDHRRGCVRPVVQRDRVAARAPAVGRVRFEGDVGEGEGDDLPNRRRDRLAAVQIVSVAIHRRAGARVPAGRAGRGAVHDAGEVVVDRARSPARPARAADVDLVRAALRVRARIRRAADAGRARVEIVRVGGAVVRVVGAGVGVGIGAGARRRRQ